MKYPIRREFLRKLVKKGRLVTKNYIWYSIKINPCQDWYYIEREKLYGKTKHFTISRGYREDCGTWIYK